MYNAEKLQMEQNNLKAVFWLRQLGASICAPFKNAFEDISKRRRRIIVKNKIAHIVGIVVAIKKGILTTHRPIEDHAVQILDKSEKFAPHILDRDSCEIICAACLYIDHYLKEDISVGLRRRAQDNFLLFKKHGEIEISSDELRKKFSKWLS